jgi:biuret amidohydrolase
MSSPPSSFGVASSNLAHPRVVAKSTPYPWPYDGSLFPLQTCVVVVGSQRQFFDMSIGADIVSQHVDQLSETVLSLGGRVAHILHRRPIKTSLPHTRFSLVDSPSDGPTSDQQDEGFERRSGDTIIAAGLDGFYGSALEDYLRTLGIRYLLITGYAAEIVVDSTLRSANDRGFECLVVTDAVAPVSAELGRHALASVTMSGGIFGALGTTADVILALHTSAKPDTPPD